MGKTASNHGYGRRREIRHPVALNTQARIDSLGGRETVLAAEALVVDLSLHGARLHIHASEKDPVLNVVRRGRNCSVICELPKFRSPTFLSGEIAWMHVDAVTRKPEIEFGMHLNGTPNLERGRLAEFLDGITARG